MPDHIAQLLIEYRAEGVLVDANLLLLYVVGARDVQQIGQFSRTNTYTRDDFELCARLLGYFDKAVTTPPVLTEVSNLLGHLPGEPRRECTALLRRLIPELDEVHYPSEDVCEHPFFVQFRLTDAGIADVAADSYLVVTDDLPLYHRLANDRQAAINFNHLRTANW